MDELQNRIIITSEDEFDDLSRLIRDVVPGYVDWQSGFDTTHGLYYLGVDYLDLLDVKKVEALALGADTIEPLKIEILEDTKPS